MKTGVMTVLLFTLSYLSLFSTANAAIFPHGMDGRAREIRFDRGERFGGERCANTQGANVMPMSCVPPAECSHCRITPRRLVSSAEVGAAAAPDRRAVAAACVGTTSV